MKRTVHSGDSSMSWGKSKLDTYGPQQAKPVSGTPAGTARAKGKIGGDAPLHSTMAKSKTFRKPS